MALVLKALNNSWTIAKLQVQEAEAAIQIKHPFNTKLKIKNGEGLIYFPMELDKIGRRIDCQVSLMAMDSDNFHFGSASDMVSSECQSARNCYYNPAKLYTSEPFSILAAELMHL